MKTNNFRNGNHKLFSANKFILRTLFSISTALVAIISPVTAFGFEINKSVDIDTEIEFSNLSLDLDLDSFNIDSETETEILTTDFNYQYSNLPDILPSIQSTTPSNVLSEITKTEADSYIDYLSRLPNLNIDTLINDSEDISLPNATNALKFNFTYSSEVSQEQILGFEMAGKFWSNYIKDDVTLNISVDATNDLPENVIGGALPGMESFDYSNFRNKFEQDIRSQADFNAFNSFNTGVTGEDFHVMANGEEITGINQINMTRANAKALGLISAQDTQLDGYVMISNLNNLSGKSSWNYDFQNYGVPEDKLDFFSMAVHELGHVLGFVSSLDNAQFRDDLSESKINNQKIDAEKINQSITLLDLYRYSDTSKEFTHSVDGKNGIADLSIGGNPFMTNNRGISQIASFSSGEDSNLGGDGYQASHWKHNRDILGIMDPLLGLGKKRKTTSNDRMAMDILGWDIDAQANTSPFDLLDDVTGFLMNSSSSSVAYSIENFWQDIYSQASTSLNERIAFARADSNSSDFYEGINRMLEDSNEFYKWGWNGYYQEFTTSDVSGLWQHMSWQKVNLGTSSSVEVKSTPESGSLFGLLGLGLFGIIYRSQGFLGRKRNFK
ncbi:hypothetical protein Riv7116_5968 [Rivularia sp. PCC 7116]|uniref:NF038122 family metalloprotease n=1 Tax=Rivularia sp. PCC 7116 TaxID=373994 RepID=UPI00029F0AA0|nr:NF038122 family metalloprotease [Rivularia sp. PCC 7116]AFY58329.1 hypothetical protein Riv7116_5968 [Rivularia sp. PCC 7116]